MRILLVNPGTVPYRVPHHGLASLAAVLSASRHTVRVADYRLTDHLPPLRAILRDFAPDVLGLSLFSFIMPVANGWLDDVRGDWPDLPIVCGGPHVSCYLEDLVQDRRIDTLVLGEAEGIAPGAFCSSRRNSFPQVLRPTLPDISALPFPDYESFYGRETITLYPLVTSRGCPYHCSFCAVGVTNSRLWRARSTESCLTELRLAREQLPGLREVVIWDDNFSLDLRRAKGFLRGYITARFGLPLRDANLRADRVDEELLKLLKEAGCECLQLGAEHGNREVFRGIGKGETLEDIERAAALAKRAGLKLNLSFVIGLPEDSIGRTLDSVRLAKRLGADRCFWNILVPYRGTSAHEYFRTQGVVDDGRIPLTLVNGSYQDLPNAFTPDFTAEERVKAHRIAQILTNEESLFPHWAFMAGSALRYGFCGDLAGVVGQKMRRRLTGRNGREDDSDGCDPHI